MSEMHLSATTRLNLKRLYRFAVEITCIASSVAVFLLAIRTISTRHLAPVRTPNSIEDDDIREAVFRWQMTYNGTNEEYELTVRSEGISPDLRSQLARRYRVLNNVNGAVAATRSGTAFRTDFHNGYMAHAVALLSCDNIRRLSPDTCIVFGGIRWGTRGNSGDFHLVREHGRWKVTSYDPKIFA